MGRRKTASRPQFSGRELRDIYDKTGGHCNLCGKKLSFVNYGASRGRGPWEVDHSNPVSRGGTNYKRNLNPACPGCNKSKGATRPPAYHEKSWLERALGL